MSDNSNLNRARSQHQPDDEWYTLYGDIEKELTHYEEHFKGKTVHCPCDGRGSNFAGYFGNNFNRLDIERLILTEYNDYGHHGRFWDSDNPGWWELESNGSFDAYDVGKLMLEADIIITNPPFSLMLPFLNQVYGEFKKDFLVVAPVHALRYEVVRRNLEYRAVRLGATGRLSGFERPDRSVEKLTNTIWLTTLDHGVEFPELELTEEYCPQKHPYIDGFDMIYVSSVAEIPFDWRSEMAVPYTFLEKWNWNQFEIVGNCDDWNGGPFSVDGQRKFKRLVIRRR